MEVAPVLILLGALVLGVLVAVVVALARARGEHGGGTHALARIESRLDEQTRAAEARAHRGEELIREMDRGLREGQARWQQDLERRLGELHAEQIRAAAELKSSLVERFELLQKSIAEQLADGRTVTVRSLGELRGQLVEALGEHRAGFEQRQSESLKLLQDSLQSGMLSVQKQLADSLTRSADDLGKRVEGLTRTTDGRLKEISGQVERRLTEGFEKTTETFADVLKRLALIDEAQKKITELSSNVVSLQAILADKRSRGAFGEVQLNALVRNVMPESSFALQHRLSNERVADCVLFLPPPSGTIAIDAKFPLEAYQRMTDAGLDELTRRAAERQFKQDIRKHIQDISERYIVAGETADGAVMFIPAEAVFAEIQAHHGDLVQAAQRARVWMVSPTTLMAILNTARAVLKDEATRQQVHVIQEHLAELAKDFTRFRTRMASLARHVRQAHDDVEKVHTSAEKISNRFEKIESVELEQEPPPALGRGPGETPQEHSEAESISERE